MPAVNWPLSSSPGRRPGEGMGRLVNTYVEVVSSGVYRWRRAAGIEAFAALPGVFRGAIVSGSSLLVANGGAVSRVDQTGNVLAIAGAITGSDPVTMARNNNVPLPDVVLVANRTAYRITADQVLPLDTTSFTLCNSVAFLGGYTLIGLDDGNVFASGLNDLVFDPLSKAKAEGKADGLLRVVVWNGLAWFMGPQSIEVWQNAGTSPWPLSKATDLNYGLFGRWAVAGFEDGWSEAMAFVANDFTVRALSGYTASVISTPDVEFDISNVTDRDSVVCWVHVLDGQPFLVVSGPGWTWEYNMRSGSWGERQSFGLEYWRALGSINAFGRWFVGDTGATALRRIGRFSDEAGNPLVWGADSAPLKDFPNRERVNAAYFDFTLGNGAVTGVTDPKVMLSWSLDGDATWAQPVQRSLGPVGRYSGLVRVNQLGLSTHHGVRLRWRISDAVDPSFMQATINEEPRRA